MEDQTQPIQEPVKIHAPVIRREADKDLSMEERVIAFIESRSKDDFVKLNDFIKSLFPLPKATESPIWIEQGVSKKIRNMLTKMQTDGKIIIANNNHLRLGTFYYPDSKTLKTHYHNLNSVTIEAKAS